MVGIEGASRKKEKGKEIHEIQSPYPKEIITLSYCIPKAVRKGLRNNMQICLQATRKPSAKFFPADVPSRIRPESDTQGIRILSAKSHRQFSKCPKSIRRRSANYIKTVRRAFPANLPQLIRKRFSNIYASDVHVSRFFVLFTCSSSNKCGCFHMPAANTHPRNGHTCIPVPANNTNVTWIRRSIIPIGILTT